MDNMLKAAAKPFKIKVHTIRYADDSICVSKSPEVLEVLIKPKIEECLKERAISLSEEKTKISNIDFNIRKFKEQLIIQPSKENVKSFLKEVRNVIRCNKTICTERLIGMINPKFRD